MKEHDFTLHFVGADMLRQDHFDASYEGGCDDASFAAERGHWHAMFHREAPTLAKAVFSAIHDLETSVPGLRVVTRMESDELVTISVIARRTGRSREGVRLLAAGARGPGRFPEPVDYVDAGSRMWEWNEVARWFQRYEGEEPEADGISHFTRALNGVLEARRQLAALAQADPTSVPATAAGLLKLLDASVPQSARASHAA
jgi:hypothetical protein